jgi:hypothetical protein
MVATYFRIGQHLVENEQHGNKRAEYGKETLKQISEKLTGEFGKGFSVDNLQNMRNFYSIYRNYETLSRNFESRFSLSRSHYLFLLRIDNPQERSFYEIEAEKNSWSLREMKRQFDAALFERLALSTDKEGVKRLSEQGRVIEKPLDAVKDPYILEFLNLRKKATTPSPTSKRQLSINWNNSCSNSDRDLRSWQGKNASPSTKNTFTSTLCFSTVYCGVSWWLTLKSVNSGIRTSGKFRCTSIIMTVS